MRWFLKTLYKLFILSVFFHALSKPVHRQCRFFWIIWMSSWYRLNLWSSLQDTKSTRYEYEIFITNWSSLDLLPNFRLLWTLQLIIFRHLFSKNSWLPLTFLVPSLDWQFSQYFKTKLFKYCLSVLISHNFQKMKAEIISNSQPIILWDEIVAKTAGVN